VVWRDARSGTGSEDIYGQRVGVDGALRWAAGGIAISSAAGLQTAERPVTSGGAIIVSWQDLRDSPDLSVAHVYAQRVDTSGVLGSPEVGVPAGPAAPQI